MTGQVLFDSYENTGAVIAVDLVNALTLEHAYGRPVQTHEPLPAIRRVLEVDPPSAAQLKARHVAGLVSLAGELRGVFQSLQDGDVDSAASRLNELLAQHPTDLHLAKEDGRWRLHHHPVDAALVPMVTAISAEALARLIGAGAEGRFGICDSDDCDRVYFDGSKNGSRRFCSTTCQNRVKAASFRRRQATTGS